MWEQCPQFWYFKPWCGTAQCLIPTTRCEPLSGKIHPAHSVRTKKKWLPRIYVNLNLLNPQSLSVQWSQPGLLHAKHNATSAEQLPSLVTDRQEKLQWQNLQLCVEMSWHLTAISFVFAADKCWKKSCALSIVGKPTILALQEKL